MRDGFGVVIMWLAGLSGCFAADWNLVVVGGGLRVWLDFRVLSWFTVVWWML